MPVKTATLRLGSSSSQFQTECISHWPAVDMALREAGRFIRMRRTRGAGKESLRNVGVGGGGVVVGYDILGDCMPGCDDEFNVFVILFVA